MRVEQSDVKESKTFKPGSHDPDCQLCHRGRVVCNACWAGVEQAVGCSCEPCRCTVDKRVET